jgi:hypothetical protein
VAVDVGLAVGVGVAVGVGDAVAVGVGVGVSPQIRSVSVVAMVLDPLNPPALMSKFSPIMAPDTNDLAVFRLGAPLQVFVVGL